MSIERLRAVRAELEEKTEEVLATIDHLIVEELEEAEQPPTPAPLPPITVGETGDLLQALLQAAQPDQSKIVEVARSGMRIFDTLVIPEGVTLRAAIGSGEKPAIGVGDGLSMGPRTRLEGFHIFGRRAERTLVTMGPHSTLYYCDVDGAGRRGVAIQSEGCQVLDSNILEMTSTSYDSQAIWIGTGARDVLIRGNLLQAAGMPILIGGSDRLTDEGQPSNIRIQGNILSRPVEWMQERSRVVKTLIEVKDGYDILIGGETRADGNHLFNNWRDDQDGYAVLLTVVNQEGRSPFAGISSVDVRNNVIERSTNAFMISGGDPNGRSHAGMVNITIADNEVRGIDPASWGGGKGQFAYIVRAPRNLRFHRNTYRGINLNSFLTFEQGPLTGFEFVGNNMDEGYYGANSPEHGLGRPTIAAYCPDCIWEGNTIRRTNSNNRFSYPGDTTVINL